MPQKKHKKGNKKSDKHQKDFTVNDFANSEIYKSRLKKTNIGNVVLENLEDDKCWEEKIYDFNGAFVAKTDEEGNVVHVLKKSHKKRRNSNTSNECRKENNGYDYPIDIWFILSEYIRPEDVGRFAGICKASLEVTYSAKFWFQLYRKNYSFDCPLPKNLQPECLVRKFGLRMAVIRALYYMYPSFVVRLSSSLNMTHPDILSDRLCVSMWYSKISGWWCYYFKLEEKLNDSSQYFGRTDVKRPDLLEILDDVLANPEEHCRVLQITCKHFINVPLVTGQTLKSVSETLSNGFMSRRIQLVFGYGVQDSSCNTYIVLDPVVKYKILDWWHPLYPFDYKYIQIQLE